MTNDQQAEQCLKSVMSAQKRLRRARTKCFAGRLSPFNYQLIKLRNDDRILVAKHQFYWGFPC